MNLLQTILSLLVLWQGIEFYILFIDDKNRKTYAKPRLKKRETIQPDSPPLIPNYATIPYNTYIIVYHTGNEKVQMYASIDNLKVCLDFCQEYGRILSLTKL